jgi:hypothetical protein
MFTTYNPPTIQRMPWPQGQDDPHEQHKPHTYDTWILNEDDFSWLKEPEGSVTLYLQIWSRNSELVSPRWYC